MSAPQLRPCTILGLVLALAVGTPSRGESADPWRRHTIDDSSRGADGVRLADVNADGHMDIATGWEEGGVIRIYINPGPKAATRRWTKVTVGKVKSPEDAVFVDLDRDGMVDVVSSSEGGVRTIHVHWAPSERGRYLDENAWQTQPIPATRSRQAWMFALPMQIDGAGGPDLVVGSKGRGATVGWLRSPEQPRRIEDWTYHALRDAGWIMSLVAEDMDGDGDADVLLSDRKGPRAGVAWLENPGRERAAGAAWNEHSVAADAGEVMFLTVGDLDQDGRRDIVAAVKRVGLLYLRPDDDPRRPWARHAIKLPSGCGTEKGVAICDIDRDGRNDIVFSCEGASAGKSGVRWLSCTKSPTEGRWQDHEISGSAGVKFDRLEVLDLDADGDLDVLTCEERDNLGVFWYENPTREP